jgi:hypothetical protein
MMLVAAALSSAISSRAQSEDRSSRTATDLAARIDERIEARLLQEKITPAAAVDDAEFLRRVSLDLIGRIPRVSEVRAFLADRATDKRQRLVEERLDSAEFVRHSANVWRACLLSQANAQDLPYLTPRLEAWLHREFRDQIPFDELAREILTSPLLAGGEAADTAGATPFAFYQANELKPENLAAATSRVFLGVNLDCAQCHNHPFAPWTREQFWEFASFFAGVERLRPDNGLAAGPERLDRRTLKIPGTEKLVSARFLDGREPVWSVASRPRTTLAEWLTSGENPYFARAIANRTWANFFGRGLAEPLDSLGGRTPPNHPELLDELGQALIEHDFDLKVLMRAIVSSRAYQRTSVISEPSQQNAQFLARMMVRGMTPEQVVDSLTLATGYRSDNSTRADLLTMFTRLDRPTEAQTTIVQALGLMNGRFVADATTLAESGTLRAIHDAPFLDTPGRIDTLYLATLSRYPSAEEKSKLLTYVDHAGAGKSAEALADVFWFLLNSSEFIVNH